MSDAMTMSAPTVRRLTRLLLSAAAGLPAALAAGVVLLDVLSRSLAVQVPVLAVLWLAFGLMVYLLLRRSGISAASGARDGGRGLRMAFLALAFLFPLGLIAYRQAVELFRILGQRQLLDPMGWLPAEGGRASLLAAFGLVVLFFSLLMVADRRPAVRELLSVLPDGYYLLPIVLVGAAVRLFFLYSVDTLPTSDFANINSDALAIARGEPPLNFYATTHVAVTLIYAGLYRVFGPHLVAIKLFHIAVYALAGIALYYAGKKAFESRPWAAAAGLLLAAWPSLALYSNVLSPEHLFILAACALLLAAAYFFRDGPRAPGREAAWLAVIGLLAGAAELFRPFGLLLLAAFAITRLVYPQKRSLLQIGLGLVLLLVPFWLVGRLPGAVMKAYDAELTRNVRPCNLLVGMNFEAAGQYTAADRELCTRLREVAADEAAFNRSVMGIVWQRLRAGGADLLEFVDRKFAILWANSSGIVYWAVRDVGENADSALRLARRAVLADFAIMLTLSIACLAGAAVGFFRDLKPAVFFCLLAFFGFNLMEIPLELQARYRTAVMPLMIFFACWAISALSTPGDQEHDSPIQEH